MALVFKDLVMQGTNTPGTDDFLLDPATLPGFRKFIDAYAEGECFVYAAHAVNNAGSRTGPFEIGIGQFLSITGGYKIRRTAVIDSSSDGSKTAFGAGKKHVSVVLCAAQAGSVPLRLNAVPSVFVRVDGDDANSGFEDSPAGAKRTVAGALSLISGVFDRARIVVGGAGSFGTVDTSDVVRGTSIELVAQAGAGVINIDSVVCKNACSVILGGVLGRFNVSSLRAWGAGSYIEAYGFSLRNSNEIDTSSHVLAGFGGEITIGDYVVSGNATDSGAGHLVVEPFGSINVYGSNSINSDMACSGGFCVAALGLGFIGINGSYATNDYVISGRRAYLRGSSVLTLFGAGLEGVNTLPGDAAVIDTGAQVLT